MTEDRLPIQADIIPVLERIAVALERLADQREYMLTEAKDAEAEDKEETGLTPGEILDVVSAVCKCDVLLKSRVMHYVWGRGAAMTALRDRLRWSQPMIARLFEMDHSSVSHGLVRFAARETWSTFDKQRWKEINRFLDNRQGISKMAEPGSPEAFKVLTDQSV